MLSFHPPAPANWSSLLPSPLLTVPPVILPCSFHRFDAAARYQASTDLPRPWIQIAKSTRENIQPADSGGGKNASIAATEGKGIRTPSQFIYTSEGGNSRWSFTLVQSRRRGYSYSMTNRRPFTLRLTPNG